MLFRKSLITAIVLTATAVGLDVGPASATTNPPQTDWAAQAKAAGADVTLESRVRRKRACFYRQGPRGPGYYPCRRHVLVYPFFHRRLHDRHGRRIGVRPLIRPHVRHGAHAYSRFHNYGSVHTYRGAGVVRPYRERLGHSPSYGVRTRTFRQERFGSGFGGARDHGVVHGAGITPGPRIGVGQGVPVGGPRNVGGSFRGNSPMIGGGNAARIGGGAQMGGGHMGGGHMGGGHMGGGHMGGGQIGGGAHIGGNH